MKNLTSSLALLLLGATVSLSAQAVTNEDSEGGADVTAVSAVESDAVVAEAASTTVPAAETPMSAVNAALGSVPTWVPVAAGVVGVIAIASSGGGSSSSSGATGTY